MYLTICIYILLFIALIYKKIYILFHICVFINLLDISSCIR